MTGEGAITRRMHAVHLASAARLRMAREGRRHFGRITPSAVMADLAQALRRAREAAPADRLTAWRLHDALDDAEACMADIEAEIDRRAEQLAEAMCAECGRAARAEEVE